MSINERLFSILEERHISQKDFASAIGTNSRNISSWRTRGSDPPAELICKIADFFGVSVEWLLTGEEKNRSSFVNNGSLSGNLGPNSGTVYVVNGGERILSDECAELVRVYEALEIRDRIKLLDFAFKIADENRKKGATTYE